MNKSRHCGNGIACKQATPRAALGFCSANRAENLCYQFSRGQKLPPQFRKIVGLVFRAVKFKILYIVMLSLSKHPAVRRIFCFLFFRYARFFDYSQNDKE